MLNPRSILLRVCFSKSTFPHICGINFSKNILMLQGHEGKQEWHHSPLGQFFLYFHRLLRALSPECLLNFMSNMKIPTWLVKNVGFMAFRLLENAFGSKKIESRHFKSSPQAKLSTRFLSSPSHKGKLLTPPRLRFFSKIYSHSKKRGCYNLVITFRKKKFNQEEI